MVYMKYILTWSEHKASAISDAASIAFLGQWPLVARSCLSAFIHYISLPHVSNMLISVADGTPRTITCARHGRSSKTVSDCQVMKFKWGATCFRIMCLRVEQNVCNRNAIPDINHQRPTAINETHREWKKSNHRFWCPISSHPTVVGKLLDNTASIEQYRTRFDKLYLKTCPRIKAFGWRIQNFSQMWRCTWRATSCFMVSRRSGKVHQ